MVQPDASLFEYLLSFNGIDLNPILQISPMSDRLLGERPWKTLLHYLYAVIGGSLNGKFDMNRLKQLLSHDDVDINRGPGEGEEVKSPLYATLLSPIRFDSDLDLIKAYVEAGAKVRFALSIASSAEYNQNFEEIFTREKPYLKGRVLRAIGNAGRDVVLMRAKHQELLASVRQLIGESGQE
jgi:hypothetical protein